MRSASKLVVLMLMTCAAMGEHVAGSSCGGQGEGVCPQESDSDANIFLSKMHNLQLRHAAAEASDTSVAPALHTNPAYSAEAFAAKFKAFAGLMRVNAAFYKEQAHPGDQQSFMGYLQNALVSFETNCVFLATAVYWTGVEYDFIPVLATKFEELETFLSSKTGDNGVIPVDKMREIIRTAQQKIKQVDFDDLKNIAKSALGAAGKQIHSFEDGLNASLTESKVADSHDTAIAFLQHASSFVENLLDLASYMMEAEDHGKRMASPKHLLSPLADSFQSLRKLAGRKFTCGMAVDDKCVGLPVSFTDDGAKSITSDFHNIADFMLTAIIRGTAADLSSNLTKAINSLRCYFTNSANHAWNWFQAAHFLAKLKGMEDVFKQEFIQQIYPNLCTCKKEVNHFQAMAASSGQDQLPSCSAYRSAALL